MPDSIIVTETEVEIVTVAGDVESVVTENVVVEILEIGTQGPPGAGAGITVKGALPDVADLPPTGNEVGDAYIIDGDIWVWDGAAWGDGGPIGGGGGGPIASIDLTDFANDPDTTTGLTYGYKAGRLKKGTTLYVKAAGTRVLNDNATNFVEFDPGTGTVVPNSSFSPTRFPMAVVVTSGGAIVSIVDRRAAFMAFDALGTVTSVAAVSPIRIAGSPTTVPLVILDPAAQDANGYMSMEDKTKLDGIQDGATASNGVVIEIIAGTNVTVDNTDPAYPIVSATGGGGGSGIVETIVAGDAVIVDATDPANPVVDVVVGTTSARGTMSAADKTKLDGIDSGATANSPDATLLARANHTGTQAQSTVVNLVSDLAGKAAVATTLAGYGITDAAPSSHVGAGGTAHANVVAAGAAGFMTGADKTKLDGIASGATANVGTVTNVTGSGAISVATGTTTPAISIAAASGSVPGTMSAADFTKLAGVATGATANSSDATLLARANHTGTQSADTLTDGTTNKAFLATERTKLSGIATGATANSSDATLLARANHTGTQLASTISDFTTAALAVVLTGLSLATGTAVVSTDTFLVAFGKLQKQINDIRGVMTTAGDMLIGGVSGALTRLGIGTTGQVLTVVAGAPAWATPATGAGKVVAWCKFDGTISGTNAPSAGGNVASVTKNGTGDYTINFTSALASANYVLSGATNSFSNTNTQSVINFYATSAAGAGMTMTTTACRILIANASSGGANDYGVVTIAFIAA